ncbi:hypothetical protein [Treponema sp. OMZ 838]|nr:hypothetical protein [Treponema sp. OMZ 838]
MFKIVILQRLYSAYFRQCRSQGSMQRPKRSILSHYS